MDATDVDARIAAMDPSDPEFKTRVDAWLADWAAERRRTGRLPTLNHYRRV